MVCVGVNELDKGLVNELHTPGLCGSCQLHDNEQPDIVQSLMALLQHTEESKSHSNVNQQPTNLKRLNDACRRAYGLAARCSDCGGAACSTSS